MGGAPGSRGSSGVGFLTGKKANPKEDEEVDMEGG